MLKVENIEKLYGEKQQVRALNGISVEVPKGEMVVLLGPSGCGKTTLLRILAGLEDASSGRVSFFGKAIVDTEKKVNVPAQQRNIGMVFQNYALWPHMTVADIVAYPLRNKKVPKAEAREKALAMLKVLKCDHLADRIPAQLSGGQQQRIALGRALVASPEIVFFDEPLSNVDAQLRREVRAEIRRLHNEIEFTGIYVTHDLNEALELADTIVVMSNGKVEQIGTPQDIFERPGSAYVADFMGIENKIDAKLSGAVVSSSVGEFKASGNLKQLEPGKDYRIFIRATDLDIVTAKSKVAESASVLEGWTISDIMYGGDRTDVILVKEGNKLVSSGNPANRTTLKVGDTVQLVIDSKNTISYLA